MELRLNDREVDVLRRLVDRRMDELLVQMGSSDTMTFTDSLRTEHGLLNGLLEQLGCRRPEYSMENACSVETDNLDVLGPDEIG